MADLHLIQVTAPDRGDGDPELIVAESIVRIATAIDGSKGAKTELWLSNGRTVYVANTKAEIVTKLKRYCGWEVAGA